MLFDLIIEWGNEFHSFVHFFMFVLQAWERYESAYLVE